MYLSKVIVNPRSPRGLRSVTAPYEAHRTVWRGFPSREDGGPGRVLYRVEEDKSPPALAVLVQSELAPDWGPLLEERVLLRAQTKELPDEELGRALSVGRRLRFRLRANPTLRRSAGTGNKGTRIGVYGEEEQRAWLARKGEQGGFAVVECRVTDGGQVLCRRGEGTAPQRHLCVTFEGILEVTDSDRLLEAVASGIGSGKAFGFGLLSVARV